MAGCFLLLLWLVALFFSSVNQENLESVSGFTGEDILVDDIGVTTDGRMQAVLRNGGAEEIMLNNVSISDGENKAVWSPEGERGNIEVAGTEVATFLQIEEGGSVNDLEVSLNYDRGMLTDLESRGTVSGRFDIKEASEFYDMNPLVFEVNSTKDGATEDDEFELGTGGGNFNYQLDWENLDGEGDGEVIDPLIDNYVIEFEEPGLHQVEIRGLFSHPKLRSGDELKVVSLESWGNVEYRSLSRAFRDAENIQGNFDDSPDVSSAKSMSRSFQQASNFEGDLSDWDTGNVESMNSMFRGASSFDSDLSDWDTSNVENMHRMFDSSSSFSSDLSEWCVEQISEKPNDFDDGADFEGEDDKQPNWGDPCD